MTEEEFQFPADDTSEYYAVLNLPRDASDEDVRRAYRALAQVYHPDKHQDPQLKERAQEVFGKLQEAYEILSDPNRRQIYDVYGKTGLAAGFELGTKLESVEELKKKWEEFKKKQEADRNEQLSNHRGLYQCRLDASDLAASLAGGPGARPLLRAAVVQNSVDTPVGDGGDVFYLQGQAVMRNNAGAGNLIFGYRRVLSPHDTLDGNVLLGLRCALSATSTRQVTPYTSASLTASYTAGVGMGMQVGSTRQLPYNMQGRLVRGGQTFEVPVTLSHSYADVRALAAAYVLPPLAYVAVSRCVVRPLLRWNRQWRERRAQREHAEAVRDSLQKAETEQALIAPVARRRARSEAAKLPTEGLVVLDAVYGSVESYLADGGPQQRAIAASTSGQSPRWGELRWRSTGGGAAAEGQPEVEGQPAAPSVTTSGPSVADDRPAGQSGADDAGPAGSGAGAAPAPTAEAAAEAAPPPPWLPVTLALQYQVADSKLLLHPGVPKRNQMGFADPTPGSETVRQLYVAYLYGSLVYEVRVDDLDGLALPGAGEAVWDAARRRGLLRLGAAALELPEILPPPGP
ncbi:hypothetical protein GPECTOR_179g245 [Gonium pectorale]|uniref:J domain-containing protein n=1 Tax=Gonium pectorale TaxID=33097 RepID=A0A150FX82_GONPE|nr:hypothetical protein GPECTOR_179g245 [Gonium pectorale]|eukprot:KXZ42222.1 hypothetical protein GPECTOR_179g245 [Gonium pectorale]